jgi:cyclopropane fatty-acyl-phospholipid synthase-like methyltransferase
MALPTAYDFSRHRRVLDLGGGTGSWLIALLRHYPGLEGTLFDLPNAAAVARQRLASDPGAQRAQVVAGDFFKDPIPSGHDAVLIANVIHLFSAAHNLELLRRTRAYMPDGARLLLADFWTDATHTQPPFAACWWLRRRRDDTRGYTWGGIGFPRPARGSENPGAESRSLPCRTPGVRPPFNKPVNKRRREKLHGNFALDFGQLGR